MSEQQQGLNLKMPTQNERLHDHLIRHGAIEPMTALNKLGIYRLASRVNDLRNKGVNIETNMVTVINQFGEPCKVARYVLQAEAVA